MHGLWNKLKASMRCAPAKWMYEMKKTFHPWLLLAMSIVSHLLLSIHFQPFARFMHFAHVCVLISFWINVGKLTTHKMPLEMFEALFSMFKNFFYQNEMLKNERIWYKANKTYDILRQKFNLQNWFHSKKSNWKKN